MKWVKSKAYTCTGPWNHASFIHSKKLTELQEKRVSLRLGAEVTWYPRSLNPCQATAAATNTSIVYSCFTAVFITQQHELCAHWGCAPKVSANILKQCAFFVRFTTSWRSSRFFRNLQIVKVTLYFYCSSHLCIKTVTTKVECLSKTTDGQCCSIPFTYKGVKYNSCTTADHNRLWCSLDAIYKGKWRNCGK